MKKERSGKPRRQQARAAAADARVNRGGSWNNDPADLRVANRNRNDPTNRNDNNGFRAAGPAGGVPKAPRTGATR
ncbi:MAG: SUMF1/EgtB/PvdO family nonheme iron enzyme [Armatimonadetes bacterium]|nr:SUMF1/EgtB/PvdO family nonheme iron enzyme [Armatimonadota bacterium]